jgi:hypothetical protein
VGAARVCIKVSWQHEQGGPMKHEGMLMQASYITEMAATLDPAANYHKGPLWHPLAHTTGRAWSTACTALMHITSSLVSI